MTTFTFKAKLRSDRSPRQPRPTTARPAPRRSDRAARMLALAHHLERLIEDGVLCDYADAAQVLGVSRARVTQIMDMLGLPAAVQIGILSGADSQSERRFRRGPCRIEAVPNTESARS